jgi:hypothetical protein
LPMGMGVSCGDVIGVAGANRASRVALRAAVRRCALMRWRSCRTEA